MTALLLAVVLCVGMVPTAFAAQQDSYHDPAEHWQEANNRTNELDANATVTIETFTCGECGSHAAKVLIDYDSVHVVCKVCGKEKVLNARNKFDSSAAIDLDELIL